jgi:hypothetical protein
LAQLRPTSFGEFSLFPSEWKDVSPSFILNGCHHSSHAGISLYFARDQLIEKLGNPHGAWFIAVPLVCLVALAALPALSEGKGGKNPSQGIPSAEQIADAVAKKLPAAPQVPPNKVARIKMSALIGMAVLVRSFFAESLRRPARSWTYI